MAGFALGAFNAAQVVPEQVGQGGGDVVPDGIYLLKIDSIDQVKAADPNNPSQMARAWISVVAPQSYAGKRFQWNINLWNEKPNVAARAVNEFSLLVWAVGAGQANLQHSDQLIGAQFAAQLSVSEGEYKGSVTKSMNVRKLYMVDGKTDPIDVARAAGVVQTNPAAAGAFGLAPGAGGGGGWGGGGGAAPAGGSAWTAAPPASTPPNAQPPGGWAGGAPNAAPPAGGGQPPGGWAGGGTPAPVAPQPPAAAPPAWNTAAPPNGAGGQPPWGARA